jgi:bifunctional hydroxylase/dehydrase
MSRTVVIAGAGPIGLMLACELGLAGVRSVVLERRSETDPRSPGMAINGAVVELLDQRGLLDALREHAMTLPAAHFSNLWLDMTPIADIHESSLVLPQWRLERSLETRAVELGADVRRGALVTGLAQDSSGISVAVRTTTGTDTVEGAYLVGCDGADSTVRALAGIGFPLRESRFYGIVGDIEADWSDLVPEQVGARYSTVGGTYAGTPVGPNIWRISTAEWGVEPADPTAPVTLDELNDRVERLTGTRFKTATPLWLERNGNPTANADTYRAGRVFLAGDAAHVFFPFNGQRLSSGFADAANLGWKLAADLGGWAPPDLLDSYHDERHPVGRWVAMNVAAQEALVHPPQAAQPLRELFTELIAIEEVNRRLVEMVMGLSIQYPSGAPDGSPRDPMLGRRLPHVALTIGGGGGTSGVAQLLRSGRGVFVDLSGDPTAIDGSAAAAVSRYADRVDLVLAEPDARIAAAAVLLRPDGHVAWTAARPGGPAAEPDLDTALRTWFGTPSASPGGTP